jgi:hypothetical protein
MDLYCTAFTIAERLCGDDAPALFSTAEITLSAFKAARMAFSENSSVNMSGFARSGPVPLKSIAWNWRWAVGWACHNRNNGPFPH